GGDDGGVLLYRSGAGRAGPGGPGAGGPAGRGGEPGPGRGPARLRPPGAPPPGGGAGVSRGGIGGAIAAGRLSFAFLDLVSLAGRPRTGTTYEQLCAELELPMALVQRIHEASGLGRPQPDDPLHSLHRAPLGTTR